jgi:hypothetical protein
VTPLDLFKIAQHLNMKIDEVMEQYCESYEGESSKIPVVRIKPKPYQRTCPFLKKGRCQIHMVSPSVCSLFPLGRMTDSRTGEFTYFMQPATCGNKNQSQTVRKWLEDSSILDLEHIAILWHKKIAELSRLLIKTYDKANFNRDDINAILLLTLYVFYDLEQNFEPQFERNLDKALEIAKHISTVGEVS